MGFLVSIVVPVYNVEQYLEKCVDSLKAQTYEDLEVILVDDGSTDSSGVICEAFGKSDSRFKVIHKENGGLADARNCGLDAVSGDYVTFVDSDDYVARDYVERLLTMIRNGDSDISVCGVAGFTVDESGREKKILPPYLGTYRLFAADEALAMMLRQNGFDTEAWAKMYKVSLFDGIRYPVGVYNEDLPTTYKCFLKAERVSFTSDKLYFYLQRAGSIMGNRTNVKRYSDSYKNIGLLLTDISDKRPGLIRAAESRALSVYFQSFAGADYCGEEGLKKECWEKAKKLRARVLMDPEGRPKARAAALISYLGKSAFLKAYDRFVRQ